MRELGMEEGVFSRGGDPWFVWFEGEEVSVARRGFVVSK